MSKYVHYGCGLDAPENWINYDASPTLKLQNNWLGKTFFKKKLNVVFPANAIFGDIIKGLPETDNSCDGAYCSHTLEHLALEDLRIALKNTFKILKNGACFRLVLPDIEFLAKKYLNDLNNGHKLAALDFIAASLLGKEKRSKGLQGKISDLFGNSHHLWMWEFESLKVELENVGFKNIRRCEYNDAKDNMFSAVERESRFIDSVAIECFK
jgi:SAM-dependent methyltransferase